MRILFDKHNLHKTFEVQNVSGYKLVNYPVNSGFKIFLGTISFSNEFILMYFQFKSFPVKVTITLKPLNKIDIMLL